MVTDAEFRRARRLLGEKLWGAFFWGVACGAALAVVLLLTFRGAGCD